MLLSIDYDYTRYWNPIDYFFCFAVLFSNRSSDVLNLLYLLFSLLRKLLKSVAMTWMQLLRGYMSFTLCMPMGNQLLMERWIMVLIKQFSPTLMLQSFSSCSYLLFLTLYIAIPFLTLEQDICMRMLLIASLILCCCMIVGESTNLCDQQKLYGWIIQYLLINNFVG